MTTLLPCVFCGSDTPPTVTDFGITCTACDTQVRAGNTNDEMAWNRRPAAKPGRGALKEALLPFADAYASIIRSGFPGIHSGLMYGPGEPRMLGPTVSDLAPLAAIFDQLVIEDGGSRR